MILLFSIWFLSSVLAVVLLEKLMEAIRIMTAKANLCGMDCVHLQITSELQRNQQARHPLKIKLTLLGHDTINLSPRLLRFSLSLTLLSYRSSHRRCSIKKLFLIGIYSGKHLCWFSFFNKVY